MDFETPETVLPRELVYGVLRVADAPSTSHQRVVRELALALIPFVRDQNLGEVLFAPVDVVLDASVGLVVQPDLLFVSNDRLHLLTDRSSGAPDLAIEVLSPHPRIGDLSERIEWFARYGVRECWLVNLPDRSVAVLSLHEHGVVSRSVHREAEALATRVLPGLRLTPLNIFGW